MTEADATRMRAANRARLANEAVARAAAARGSGQMSDAEAARIRARFE